MTPTRQPNGKQTPCNGVGECATCDRYDCHYWQGAGYCPACGAPKGQCNCEKELMEGADD